jgi:hypothetical protein
MVPALFDAPLRTADVGEAFASEFVGKQGPVHLFRHAFDLALGRYSGRRAGGRRVGPFGLGSPRVRLEYLAGVKRELTFGNARNERPSR